MTHVPISLLLVLIAPVLAIAAGGFLYTFRPRLVHWPMLASCAVVFLAALRLAYLVSTRGAIDVLLYRWAAAWSPGSSWLVDFGLRLDGLSAMMLLLISTVGGLIHLYSVGYMEEDASFGRFFLYFHFFYFSMLGLVIADNYVQMYLFWELVGTASYLLIGFWYHKETARRAALQAFLTNRVGDLGFLAAVFILMAIVGRGDSNFTDLFQLGASINPTHLALVGFLIFWAAAAKSAQFPLYFWLPDAMEGPTPVSALMHAATMVTAGIFLLARSWPLISLVEGLGRFVAAVGALTAIGSAIIAVTKTDLKRILAYSTVSHLGIMAMGIGLGKIGGAMFHLLTHGFFKATLFLCAGNIAHALHKPTADVSEAGGLRKYMPVTFGAFTVAALSLAGVYPFAGFFSKDAIIGAALERGGIMAAAGLLIAFLSALYIFRMLFLVFWGPRSWQHPPEHPHEAGAVMAVPVSLLAAGAFAIGMFAVWGHHLTDLLLRGWAGSAVSLSIPGFEWPSFLAGTSMLLFGAGAAYFLTTAMPDWDPSWRASRPALARLFDTDFYYKSFVSGVVDVVLAAARAIGGIFDSKVVDGAVEGTGPAVRALSARFSAAVSGSLNDYLWWLAAGAAALLGVALRAR